jgi:hypothetical protein
MFDEDGRSETENAVVIGTFGKGGGDGTCCVARWACR